MDNVGIDEWGGVAMVDEIKRALFLADIVRGRLPSLLAETIEHLGDSALADSDWQRALTAYEECEEGRLRIDEKRGWCLGKRQAWAEAMAVLAPHRNELSGAGLTMLAIASVGGWNFRYRRSDAARVQFDDMLSEALADEAPEYLTYAALFWFRHYRQEPSVLLAHARRGVSLYPDEPYLRLQLAKCLWQDDGNEAEIHSVLEDGLDAHATTEYLWWYANSARRLGRWQDALACLDRALAMTSADGGRSRQTALQMQFARGELLEFADRLGEAIEAYQVLAALNVAEDGSIVLAARRALLVRACRNDTEEAIRTTLNRWLAVSIAFLDRSTATSVLAGEPEPVFFFDGESDDFSSGDSLLPYREQLLEVAEGEGLGVIRFLFAEHERDRDDGFDRQAYADAMLQAADETSNPIILGGLAAAYAFKKRPDWCRAGNAWARHELHRLSGGASTFQAEPLDTDNPPSDTAIRAYAKGMRQAFETAISSPHLSEIFASLRSVLVDRKIYRVFRDMAEQVAAGSDDANVIFDAALGAHWCQDRARAIALYWDVLSRDKTHYSALHNLLLLYHSPADAAAMEKVAALVATLPAENSERRTRLLKVLTEAREACRDPEEVARSAIGAELRQYPSLLRGALKAAKVPLQDAVTLVTLMKACEPAVGELVFSPFARSGLLFSPTNVHRRGLFRLLESGLVAIDGDTPLDAFAVKEGKVRGYHFERIWWRVSPATIALVQSIKELTGKSVWPRAWCEDVKVLAESIAEEECVQYLAHAAESRNWPIPDDDAKAHALARTLVQHVSVSEAFYLIYLGAMAASDYRQRHPVSSQQASNVMVLRASQRLERWLKDPWPLKSYSRSNEVSRSEISRVLYDEFLRLEGDGGFSEPVSRLPYPRSRKPQARA
ncbi:hypothetical protein XA1311A_06330 [Xanthomonas arboricola]|uniref:tetratricopeptide repeat protein n=1 Tax=Xanthomonas arboricola TaxID=56448 RepID=UPI001E2C2A3E|nr:tetratricopeptide repeat protein [Xanthomonas arboricola]CAE6709221.1 hypothetical protein XA1311A_06330 [Xanthomonas arboricola]CAE6709231.1 hypothetical protein XA1311A_06330 [Xanthomonas arboricola]